MPEIRSSSAVGGHSQPGVAVDAHPLLKPLVAYPTRSEAASACLAPQLQALYRAQGPGCAAISPSLLPGAPDPQPGGVGCVCVPGRGRIPPAAPPPRPRRLAARRVLAAEPGEERPRLSRDRPGLGVVAGRRPQPDSTGALPPSLSLPPVSRRGSPASRGGAAAAARQAASPEEGERGAGSSESPVAGPS